MTERLRQAVAHMTSAVEQAERLGPTEQDILAAKIETIVNEIVWEHLLNDPDRAAAIDTLADEALADLAAGKTHAISDVFGDDEL